MADAYDAFPLNANESADFDSDGVGDNADTDLDGDGLANTSMPSPLIRWPARIWIEMVYLTKSI